MRDLWRRISKGYESNRKKLNIRVECNLSVKTIQPYMCFVLCKLQPLLTYLLLHDVLRSSVLWTPPWEALPQSLTHSGWTKLTYFYALQCGAAASLQQQTQKTAAHARRFHGEEPAYVMAEHCRASEKRMLRGATAIKGVWAIGKPRGGRSHAVIEATSPPAGHF